MRIEKELYPPLKKKLEFIVNRDNQPSFELVREKFMKSIKSIEFKRDIKLISDSFMEAFYASFKKISVELLTDFINNERNSYGTLLLKNNSIVYLMDSRESEHKISLTMFQGELLTFSFFWENNEDRYAFYDTNNFEPINDIKYWIFALLWFIKHCPIEVRQLPPNRTIFEGVNCIYNNKTDSTIKIIDSTWFTTLIKSDAFKVRGHFRLQPYGEGMSKRKLIWINEFQKEGYIRKAGKDVEGEGNLLK